MFEHSLFVCLAFSITFLVLGIQLFIAIREGRRVRENLRARGYKQRVRHGSS